METIEERFPFLFNKQADYNTNSQSYYDGLAKYNKILQILAKMIEEYDDKLDNSLENINTVLTNYTTMLDGKLAGFDDSVMLLLREWIDDGTFEMIINTEIFNHKLDTATFNAYKENADSVALSHSEQLAETETQLKNMTYKRINVRDYGAKGDGVTDDSQAIRDAISALDKNGGVLEFPLGVYLHGDGVTTGADYPGYTIPSGIWAPDPNSDPNLGRDIRFYFERFKNLTIIGNDSTIVSNELNGETRNNAIFDFRECDNLKVYDLIVDGNLEVRAPQFSDRDDGRGHLIRGNIYIHNCRDVYFKNVKSHYSMLDGIFAFKSVNGESYNHIYEDCVCKYNYRQGLTLSSVSNVKVVRGEYSYTGTIFGILPKAGIDVEADASYAENVSIKGTVFKENASNNLVLSFHSTKIVVDDCQFYGRSGVVLEDPLNKGNILKNCKFFNSGLTVAQEEVKIIDNVFYLDVPRLGFVIDWYNVPDNDGSFSEFSGNKVKCVLPTTIDTTQKIYYGLLRVVNAKVRIHNNEFVDVLATKYEADFFHAIRLIGYEVTDNQFLFTRSFDTKNTQFDILSTGRIYGNKITGYTEKEVVSVDLVTGYKLIKRFNVAVTTGTPITFELSNSRFFKVTAYDSNDSHYEEKVFVLNAGGGSILGSEVISTINPSEVRKFESSASYDFSVMASTCTITPNFTGTLYVDIESNSARRDLNEQSITKR